MTSLRRTAGCLLAAVFLGRLSVPAMAATEPTVIEMPYAPSLTAKDGSIRVTLQGSRKVHVAIQKMTQEGSDLYYDVVLDPASSKTDTTEYVFYLDCCEYNLDTALYASTYQLTISDESTPEAVYTEKEIAIFDPHWSETVDTTCYQYTVTMLEGTTGGVITTVPKETISNRVRTVENQITLRYVPTIQRGDVDGNGTIEVADAVGILTYYAKTAAGIPSAIDARAADVNQDGVVDVADAVGILTYYAKQAAGLPPAFQ